MTITYMRQYNKIIMILNEKYYIWLHVLILSITHTYTLIKFRIPLLHVKDTVSRLFYKGRKHFIVKPNVNITINKQNRVLYKFGQRYIAQINIKNNYKKWLNLRGVPSIVPSPAT